MSTMHGGKKRDWDDGGRLFATSGIGPLGLVFCLALAAAAVAILDYGVLPPLYRRDLNPPADLRARVDFSYNDPQVLQDLRIAAAEQSPRVYVEDRGWADYMLHDLAALCEIVKNAPSANSARDQAAARNPLDGPLAELLYTYNDGKDLLDIMILRRLRNFLLSLTQNNPIVAKNDLNFERVKRGERQIISTAPSAGGESNESYKQIALGDLRSVELASEEVRTGRWRSAEPRLSPELQEAIYRHLDRRIKPNLTLDAEVTRKWREMNIDVVGDGDVLVRQDDLILEKDKIVLKSALDKLYAEYKACKASLPREARIKHLAGLACAMLCVLAAFVVAVSRMDHKAFRRRRAMIMLGLLALGALALTRGLILAGYSAAWAPFVFIGIVASLAFSQAVALLTLLGLALATTLAGVRWEAFPLEGSIPALGVALLAGGIIASLPAERLRNRWDLLKYGLLAGVVQFVLVGGMAFLGTGWVGGIAEPASGWERVTSVSPRAGVPSFSDALFALASAPLWAFMVLGMLPVIEALFGILTNIRLAELADGNHPLLQRMQLEAGGTHQHTLQVRFLAEPAAKAIGANDRLIAAGVLFHDIGKLNKPEYFVENRMDAERLHQRLRPSLSAYLIIAHVKDGIEMAHECGLPQRIIDFIPEHHGTTLVSYFFHSARRQAEAEAIAASAGAAGEPGASGGGAETVQEAFFRYPGPKPQSRETAIVMLADTVEAATRTLDDPTPARLQEFVHKLIMEKLLDGQLDECDLTFAEIAQIEEAFLRVLVARFHSRVRYPEQEGEAQGAGDAESAHPGKPDGTKVAAPAPSSRREVMTETRILGRSSDRKPKGDG